MPEQHQHTLSFIERLRLVSIPFLLFLGGMLYVKLYIKFTVLILYAIFLFYKRISFPKRLPSPVWFYLLIIPVGLLAALWNGSFNSPVYWRGAGIGVMKWLVAGGGFYLLYTTLKYIDNVRIIATIKAFFLLNAFVSILDLAGAIIRSGRLMPYWIQDMAAFGISTGDYINGLSRDNSITNAALNMAGVLFFLFRKDLRWALTCLVVALLCTSNFSVILLLTCLVATIILIPDKQLRKYAGICILSATGIYCILSMQNIFYTQKTIKKEITGITSGQQHWSGRHGEEGTSESHSDTRSSGVIGDLRQIGKDIRMSDPPRLDTGAARAAIRQWYGVSYEESSLGVSGIPGKLYSLLQTGNYMGSGLRPMVLGAGMGNFASNLAIKMTGLGIHGYYPPQYIYVHSDFLYNQLYIWMFAYAHTREFQSVTQLPASVYSQLGGEYGITGLGLFFFLYVLYFLKRNRFQARALIMTGLLLGYFFVDYWFEMISLTVVFELFMLADPQNNRVKKSDEAGI